MTMTRPIRVIVIFAHPDEGEKYAGGTSALFAEMGHKVKFLALTNGDAGHFGMKGKELSDRRAREAQEAAARLGVEEYDILDYHDGELLASLEVRNEVIRQIRRWEADIVIAFHPEGCAHADNSYAGKAVSDAAAFVALVPNVVPDVPCLKNPPLFLLMPDYSMKEAYKADIVVDIGATIEKKLLGCDAHASQYYEYQPWSKGLPVETPERWEDRRRQVEQDIAKFLLSSPEMKPAMEKWYGKSQAERIQYAEPFEIAKYGGATDDETIAALFPMFGIENREVIA